MAGHFEEGIVVLEGLLSSLVQVTFHRDLKSLVSTTESVKRYFGEWLLRPANIVNISRQEGYQYVMNDELE